jgi:hypothetical protein
MSSIAQEESRKTSERVRWGQKRRMEQGFAFGSSLFGYHLKDGKFTINEDEAQIVRLIYELYLSGLGVHLMRKELENRGIPAPNGGVRWREVTVLAILKNEKYNGTLKQRKTITLDYLSHKSKINYGEEKFIIIENNHTPIISKETFDKVQAEIQRRKTSNLDRSRYSSRVMSLVEKSSAPTASHDLVADNQVKTAKRAKWFGGVRKRYGTAKRKSTRRVKRLAVTIKPCMRDF